MSEAQFGDDANSVVSAIQDSVRTVVIKHGEDEFLTRPVFLPPKQDLTLTLACATLTALADYLNTNIDLLAENEPVVIHVESPSKVNLYHQVTTDTGRRFRPLSVMADLPEINLLDRFVKHDKAMIELQSKFVQTDALKTLLGDLGNLAAEEEIGQADDGVTQEVIVRGGVERRQKNIENPVSLAPFRTFAEIEQPVSPFVLRLEKSGGISVGLFEADGGAWRNTARQSIKAFLKNALDKEYAILA